MVYFCKECAKTHNENELCPYIKRQIQDNPDYLGSAADFVNVAGQYQLVTSQGLDTVAQKINGVVGKNLLSFEGTHQFARDIQVFERLNVEVYSRAGYFSSPEVAKAYLENATKGQLSDVLKKTVGAGGEVDWLREKQGELKSIIEKSTLLNKNAAGVDGEIVNRFTGEEITRVTAKTASTSGGLDTGSKGIIKALTNGTLAPDETAYVTEGMKDKILENIDLSIDEAIGRGENNTADILKQAKENLNIIERGDIDTAAKDAGRVIDKAKDGKAFTSVPGSEVVNKAAQGAVIGAVVGLTISGITNYVQFRKGELSRDEAFVNIGQDTTKGTLIGGAMGAVTVFLPAGVVGFMAGMVIGFYLNSTLTNVLDEIFGKGAYREILIASGCVMGVSMNLSEVVKEIAEQRKIIQKSTRRIEQAQAQTNIELEEFDELFGGIT